jgi:hypothetical protein
MGKENHELHDLLAGRSGLPEQKSPVTEVNQVNATEADQLR